MLQFNVSGSASPLKFPRFFQRPSWPQPSSTELKNRQLLKPGLLLSERTRLHSKFSQLENRYLLRYLCVHVQMKVKQLCPVISEQHKLCHMLDLTVSFSTTIACFSVLSSCRSGSGWSGLCKLVLSEWILAASPAQSGSSNFTFENFLLFNEKRSCTEPLTVKLQTETGVVELSLMLLQYFWPEYTQY